ncbi:MAG: DUF1570 domain-containing protein [Planctomycetia bacterium]|nr:DUF1570 domain-containing protein [Planctomycetia bacterium]
MSIARSNLTRRVLRALNIVLIVFASAITCKMVAAQTASLDAPEEPTAVSSGDDSPESASTSSAGKSSHEQNAARVATGRVCVKLTEPFGVDRRTSGFDPNATQTTSSEHKPARYTGLSVLGRPIADFRLSSGRGFYLVEDDSGELLWLPQRIIESVEEAPDATVESIREAMKKTLAEELGDGFQFKETEHFLFAYDTSEGYVEWCMRLFESLEDGFRRYALRQNFELNTRVEPMPVLIFASKAEFLTYSIPETGGSDQVAAFYSMQTNRVALYDLSQVEGGREEGKTRRRRTLLETKEFLSRPNAAFNVATIVHEATHQIAFNRGLFLRCGPIALWSVEGLSLLFETPNGKASQDGWGYRSNFPTNERLLKVFIRYVNSNQLRDPLRSLVRQDVFYKDLEGSYAFSWALFYYLYKKRPKDLAAYMTEMSKKDPCAVYTPEQRVEDFEKFFGDDWDKLTTNLFKFIKKL